MDTQRKLKELREKRPRSKKRKIHLVPTSDSHVYRRMLDDLRKSGLDASDAKEQGYKPCTTDESKTLDLSRIGEGMRITYYDMKGKLLPMFRYRYFDTKGEGFLEGVDQRKYDQSTGSRVEIYLPRGVDWEATAKAADKPLVVTEGEKKAACATKNGFDTIALGGVWSFGKATGDQRLHPTLAAFEWKGRNVYVAYDSDAAKNPDVMRAENRLAGKLLDAGALVYVVRIPPDGDAKVGIDDYIVKHGADAFKNLMDSTRMWDESRELHELNGLYVVCQKTASIYQIDTGLMFSRQEFETVIEAPRKYDVTDSDGKKHVKRAAKEWVQWPVRNLVHGVAYDPGAGRISKGCLNVWVNPCIEPREGSTKPFDELLSHLVPDAKKRTWMVQWAAYPLQNRGSRNNTAVLVWSRTQGQGKSLLGETVGFLHGHENYIEIQQKQLESDFNAWQPRRTFIMGSELCGTSARDALAFGNQLKSLITATEIDVNEKYEKAYQLPNRANYFLTSNHPTALHLDEHARRFFVVNATEKKLPQEFYTRFVAWRDNGGLSALLYKMLRVDLTGFDPGADAPQTEDMLEMAANDRSDLQEWCHELHEDSQAVLARQHWSAIIAKNRFATTDQLMRAYLESTQNARINRKQLTLELKAAGFVQANDGGLIRIGDRKSDRRERLWIIRDFKNAVKLTPNKIGDEWQAGGVR